MKHVPAHYDGSEKLSWMNPSRFPVNTPLEVVVPDSPEESTQRREGTSIRLRPCRP